MAMIGKVLRMHRRDKKSVREIALATSLARNTVRKYLRTDRVEELRRSLREEAPIKLAPPSSTVRDARATSGPRKSTTWEPKIANSCNGTFLISWWNLTYTT